MRAIANETRVRLLRPMVVTIDIPPVTQDEALELMMYHMRLAAAYYEGITEDKRIVQQELRRVFGPKAEPKRSLVPEVFEEPVRRAAGAFVAALDEYYDELAKEQGD